MIADSRRIYVMIENRAKKCRQLIWLFSKLMAENAVKSEEGVLE